MKAAFGRHSDVVESLLRTQCDDPAVKSPAVAFGLFHGSSHSSLSLASNSPHYSWSTGHCPLTEELIRLSMVWSPESHYLFPAGFRAGVHCVMLLQVALLKEALPILNENLWFYIVQFLPRNWSFAKFLWCLHLDCLEAMEPFHSNAELYAHQQSAHGMYDGFEAAWIEASSCLLEHQHEIGP